MRMRKKKWAVPELEASPLFVKDPVSRRESWQEAFAQSQPLYLELGCGKGGFASRFALANPQVNLLAVDISSNMLGVGRRSGTVYVQLIAADFSDSSSPWASSAATRSW